MVGQIYKKIEEKFVILGNGGAQQTTLTLTQT